MAGAMTGFVGPALAALGTVDVWQGRFDEADDWLERASQVVRPELEPATGLLLHRPRGRLCAARGRPEEAADRLQQRCPI
jgi:LuxR family transcriptional regulator, maltose regulon positive regulatory protein